MQLSLLTKSESGIPSSLKRLHYELRTSITRYAFPYLWLKRWQQQSFQAQHFDRDDNKLYIKWSAINRDTAIVIEGYPRSGNTFASSAFRLAQERPLDIAYRLHAPIQLIAAAKQNIPAILLIRKPEDAVLSWVIHRSHLTLEQALVGYVSFYTSVLPYKDYFVIADFQDVITDFGRIIREVNHRFDTNFQEFVHTEENVQKCFAAIDDFYRNQSNGQISEKIVARPSANRKQLKETLREQFQAESLSSLRDRANQLYQMFVLS